MTAAGSRELRRELGPIAWTVLADILDDAAPDGSGRLLAATSARRVAANLGVSKDTAARALARLVAAGLLDRVPAVRAERGRFGTAAYVICIDTPAAVAPPPLAVRARPGRQLPDAQASLFDVQ